VNTGIFEPLLQLGSILEGYVAVVVHWWTGELITRGHAIAITRALAQKTADVCRVHALEMI
jgi:hypothetical protein